MTETVDVTFDVDALRQKYADERARRLRPDGIAQYVEIAGEFARFAEDPWADGEFAREPLTDEVDVAIIGAGFGGLLTGVRLRELGVESVRLIDRAADVGGTWYWNRYPGIACDVESYVYIPLLEELGYIPAEKYAKGAEILAHCRRIAEHYDLYRDACLQTDVHEIRWEACDFPLDHPAPTGATRCGPDSCPWPTDIKPSPSCRASPASTRFAVTRSTPADGTTATPAQKLENLAGKRVGIIGTGATAIQCVPHLGRGGAAPLRLPAHTVVGGRARQRAYGSAVGQRITARLAAASASRTFRSSPPADRPTRIWSPMPGPASPGSFRSCAMTPTGQ